MFSRTRGALSAAAVAKPLTVVAGLTLAAGLMTACGGGGPAGPSPTGMVTFAEGVGSPPTYIFPMYNGANSGNNNITYLQPLMWRPLYWFGHPNNDEPTLNTELSLASPPVYSNGGKTVTITMKHYKWSDGKPVTSRDVQFWMNMLIANHSNWGLASPGDWSTHITKMQFPSPYRFSITFNQAFNHNYLLYTGLSQVSPIPQHVWDKTSASGPVGNYDRTTSGAKAVYKFLNAQSLSLKTWDTNPLWQVVDGPYHLQPKNGFETTGQTILDANPHYSGPDKPKLARFEEVPFTSDSSEFAAVLSGKVDYGYLPFSDLHRISALKSSGYRVMPWLDWGFSAIQLSFNNPKAGPVFRQLYFREAMQKLVNQSELIHAVLGGYGVPSYGPVPVQPASDFVSPGQRHDPYPYDPKGAVALLKDHGWRIPSHGAATCVRPGTAANDCGAGIPAGKKLAFTMVYVSGDIAYLDEVQALRSSFLRAGIQVTATGAPFGQALSDAYLCQTKTLATCPANSAQLAWWGSPAYTYVPVYYPSGETLFQTGGGTNSMGYSNARNDANVRATHLDPGLQPMYRYEDYLAKQIPMLWIPNADYQISVLSHRLKGVVAQDSTGHIYPEDWSVKS